MGRNRNSFGGAKGKAIPTENVNDKKLTLSPKNVRPLAKKDAPLGKLTTIYVIDPKPLTRHWIAGWLTANIPEFHIKSFSDVTQVLHSEDRCSQAIAAFLHISAAHVDDPRPLEHLDRLYHRLPDVPVIVLSDFEEVDYILNTFRHGARGYVPTSLNPQEAILAIRLIGAGEVFAPAGALLECLQRHRTPTVESQQDLEQSTFDGFTPRQSEVLSLLRMGKSNKAIAYELSMRESTVKVHISHIMKKLRATNRTQAVFLLGKLLDGNRSSEAELNADQQPDTNKRHAK
jgi:DNA-binding NarL/FixJ family response regulator